MNRNEPEHPVPCSYTRIIARELGLQERDLGTLLNGTGLPVSILLSEADASITAAQQLRVLDNGLHMLDTPEFGLRLGRQMQPSTHGPMGYLVLSSPDVITALESFAGFLPVRLPFSKVTVALEGDYLTSSLTLKVDAKPAVRRVLQECFALMIQSVVESVLGRQLHEASIKLAHAKPNYHALYRDYFHSPVNFSGKSNVFMIPAAMARLPNVAGRSDSYAAALDLCRSLIDQMPATDLSNTDRIRRLLLSAPPGALTATDVAQAMFVTKRTLQRRLEREGTGYREITEKLYSELAVQHLRETNQTIESVAVLLGYYDTAAFRKAFHRWYGQSPGEYRHKQ
jgi:AraC-like DNA-binding protein